MSSRTLAGVAVLVTLNASMAQGILSNLSNEHNGQIIPIEVIGGLAVAPKPNVLVQVFVYDSSKPGGFGTPLGTTVSIGDGGRFNAGSEVLVPGVAPGSTATLIVRAWDRRSALTYEEATYHGNTGPFLTELLGGDPDGSGPLPFLQPGGMTSGKPDGFKTFAIVLPEPATTALLGLGLVSLLAGTRRWPGNQPSCPAVATG